MKAYIIDNCSTYISLLEDLLSPYNPSVIPYDHIETNKIDESDMLILSGGHAAPVLWHNEQYAKEIDLIRNHKGPVIGICLGFQLIAHIYGSHLHYLGRRRKGLTIIKPLADTTLLSQDAAVQVFESHNWSVRILKNPLIALAESEDGIELFRHSHKPIYGMQFHPESSESGSGRIIFQCIIDELKSGSGVPNRITSSKA